jgi:putative FmdB family regulatory protein
MPLYEYQCSRCRARFEVIQKASDMPRQKCPKCGGALKKVISPPALQFKGSGWYITDYAKKKGPEAKTKPEGDKKESTPPGDASPKKD